MISDSLLSDNGATCDDRKSKSTISFGRMDMQIKPAVLVKQHF
jgi:hypothetical protein